MAYPDRRLTTITTQPHPPSSSSGLRQPSFGGGGGGISHSTTTGYSPVLAARINEKRAELANLKQLQDLSADLAAQMRVLEEKLAGLGGGMEGMFFRVFFILC